MPNINKNFFRFSSINFSKTFFYFSNKSINRIITNIISKISEAHTIIFYGGWDTIFKSLNFYSCKFSIFSIKSSINIIFFINKSSIIIFRIKRFRWKSIIIFYRTYFIFIRFKFIKRITPNTNYFFIRFNSFSFINNFVITFYYFKISINYRITRKTFSTNLHFICFIFISFMIYKIKIESFKSSIFIFLYRLVSIFISRNIFNIWMTFYKIID